MLASKTSNSSAILLSKKSEGIKKPQDDSDDDMEDSKESIPADESTNAEATHVIRGLFHISICSIAFRSVLPSYRWNLKFLWILFRRPWMKPLI